MNNPRYQYPVGNPGGPGRPKTTPEQRALREQEKKAIEIVKEIREENQIIIAKALQFSRNLTMKELDQIRYDGIHKGIGNVLEIAIACTWHRVIHKGYPHELSLMINLLCGPEPKQLEVSGPDGESFQPSVSLTVEQLTILWQEAQKTLKEARCKTTSLSSPSPPLSLPLQSDMESCEKK